MAVGSCGVSITAPFRLSLDPGQSDKEDNIHTIDSNKAAR